MWSVTRCGQGSADFQQRLLGTLRRLVDHKGPGARWLLEHGEAPGLLLAYCVAGHHGGLPDFHNSGRDGAASLRQLCAGPYPCRRSPLRMRTLVRVLQPPFAPTPFGLSFFTRLLFSALVDADYTDTEAFTQPAKAAERQKGASARRRWKPWPPPWTRTARASAPQGGSTSCGPPCWKAAARGRPSRPVCSA